MSIKGSFIYFLITSILTILAVNSKNIMFLLLILIWLIFSILKFRNYIAIINIVFCLFFSIYRVNKEPIVSNGYQTMECKVIDAKEKYIIVKNQKTKYLMYVDDGPYYENDVVLVYGEVNKIEKDLDIDVFEFETYIKNKRVFYKIDGKTSIELLTRNKKTSVLIKDLLTSKLYDESLLMTKMLVFNDKDADIESYENLRNINATHLFVVSGFHISFFFSLLCNLFPKRKNLGLGLSTFICLIYIFLLDFSISATRAFISLLLAKLFEKKLSSFDCLSIPGILFLLIEPLYVYNYSFILTFIMVFVKPYLVCYENKFITTTLTIAFSFMACHTFHNFTSTLITIFVSALFAFDDILTDRLFILSKSFILSNS